MKNFINRLLAFSMALLVIFSVAGVLPQAQAAEAGTLVSNPIILIDGEYHTKWWTSSNDDLNCYNKIEVPSRGYITFTAVKPFDDEGEMGSYYLYLYKQDGTLVWTANTSAQKDSFSDTYVYKIGLEAGTYYMNLDPSFFIYSNSAPIQSSYKYSFTADNYWETEPNNTKDDATVIELNTAYSGVYTDESYKSTYMDYFAVELISGEDYTIKIDNYAALDAGSLIAYFVTPDGEEDSLYNAKEEGNVHCWNITATTTGTYYIKLDNDGNDAGVEYKIGVYKCNHVSDAGTVTDEPTNYSEGLKTYKCTLCGKALRVESIPSLSESSTSSSGTNNTQKSTKPAKVKLTSAKSLKKKRVTVSWKKVNNANGYLVQYSTSKKFTAKTTKTVTVKKVKVTVKKLKSKKKYFVRVRAFRNINGEKVYGAWSKAKAVKIK